MVPDGGLVRRLVDRAACCHVDRLGDRPVDRLAAPGYPRGCNRGRPHHRSPNPTIEPFEFRRWTMPAPWTAGEPVNGRPPRLGRRRRTTWRLPHRPRGHHHDELTSALAAAQPSLAVPSNRGHRADVRAGPDRSSCAHSWTRHNAGRRERIPAMGRHAVGVKGGGRGGTRQSEAESRTAVALPPGARPRVATTDNLPWVET